MSASEAKRCCLRSLSYWSRKTLESNKSVKELPPDINTPFVPAAWRSSMQATPRRRRRTWEIALALALKDALRSGDIFLPDSRRHVSFWHRARSHFPGQQVKREEC